MFIPYKSSRDPNPNRNCPIITVELNQFSKKKKKTSFSFSIDPSP